MKGTVKITISEDWCSVDQGVERQFPTTSKAKPNDTSSFFSKRLSRASQGSVQRKFKPATTSGLNSPTECKSTKVAKTLHKLIDKKDSSHSTQESSSKLPLIHSRKNEVKKVRKTTEQLYEVKNMQKTS